MTHPTMNAATHDDGHQQATSLVGGTSAMARGLRWVRLASVLIIVASLIALVRLLPADRLVAMLSSTVEQLGAWGPVLFGTAYVLAAVLFVPGSALTLAAGALFGLWWGTVTVSLASTTAAGVAFLIGRYLARDSVRHWAGRSPKFTAIDGAIGERGWKIIALLRLSPAVPFSLGNYLYGLTAIRFWPYVITSWLAMLPGTFMYVYLGYAGRAAAFAALSDSRTAVAAAATGAASRSSGQWALLVIGLLATIVVTVYVTRIARKAIKEHTAMKNDSSASPEPFRIDQQVPAGRGHMRTIATAVFALALAGGTAYAYANRSLIAGLFGPPAVTLAEKYKDKPAGPAFDHSTFNALLKKHVNSAGLVDYKGLKKDADQLDKYIASLAKAPIDQMGRDQRLALLVNGYNAFTLRLILDHYPIKSIKDIPAEKRWDDKRWNIGGHVWSLNQIEQEQIRPNFKEPRIHFALVCAAVGCPPLRNEAYRADRLEEQLQAQAVYVHSHDRWFQFDPKTNTLKLTSLYNWYGGDFEQVAGSAVKYAARYSPALKKALDAGHTPKVQFLDYDWSLNSQEGRS